MRDRRLQDNVFLGGLAYPSGNYRGYYFYIQPCEIESLGLSVLDAIKFSMRCIVSNHGCLPELVEDGVSGFVFGLEGGPKVFANNVRASVFSWQTLTNWRGLRGDLCTFLFSGVVGA